MRTLLATLLVGAVIVPGIAQAQTSPDQDANRAEARLDRILDRDEATRRVGRGPAAAADGTKKAWTLQVGTPLAFNSNIGNETTGGKSSSYVDPSIALTGSWDLGKAKLVVEAGTDAQVFGSNSAYDNGTVYGNVNLSLPGTVTPYVDYTAAALYDGIFDQHSVTLHMLTLGAKTKFPLGDKANILINANVMRREASIAGVEQWRYGLTATYVHGFDDGSSIAMSARGRFADFTGGTNATRTDKNMRLALSYDLPLDDELTFGLGASFERNWSNRANRSYSIWDLGPTVTFSRSF